MEEESEECEFQKDINNITDKIHILENNDLSSSDPIPSLLLPIKKIKKPQSAISHIISDSKTNKMNLNQIQIKISTFLINKNLQLHNSSPEIKNMMLINDLIESKENHFIAVFKDYLISDYKEEFLRRYFSINEIIEVLPKFYQYYKNYLNFFCKGTFCDFDLNGIIQEYGECQAEFYYNRNYGHKDRKSKKDKKENIDENNKNESNDKYENENNIENISNMGLLKTIFTQTIKYSIEKEKKSKNEIKKEELSNIKPYNNSKENTIILPDNSTVSYNDIITKENSIRYIINLMNKKNQRINLNKRIKNKKKDILSNKIKNNDMNTNKNANNDNKINMNKKGSQNLSKTTSNLNIKNSKKNKNIKSRNNNNNLKTNYLTSNAYRSKNVPSISNYKKFIDILTNKQKNKSNKSNEPRMKIYQDDFNLSSQKNNNKKNKLKNIISSFKTKDIFCYLNLFSNKNNIFGNKNKVNSSLFLLHGNDKYNKNFCNYNVAFPLTISKKSINKNKANNNKKLEKKEKRKSSKNKDKDNNINSGKYLYFNQNIKSFIKTIKNASSSPKTSNNNIYNNINNNKTLSYSTVNNCSININNNIILSNNYFNNKHHQINNLSKKIFEKNLQQKKFSIYNNIIKSHTSRNNQTDLNRFKTEVNLLNSLINQNSNKNKDNKNISNNNQFKSFRKSCNNEILIKNKYLDKNKKYNNSNNHQRNLSLKNIPITIRSNLYNNCYYTSNKISKLLEEMEFSSTNKTYKNLPIKKNKNSIQKKIIFDYKRK